MQPKIQETTKIVDARLEAAMAGRYSFSMNSIFDEAWAKTKGFKSIYWGAVGVVVLMALAFFTLTAMIVGAVGLSTGGIVGEQLHLVTPLEKWLQIPMPMFLTLLLLTLIALFIFLPLFAGLWMMSITHVTGRPIYFKMLFSYFKKPVRYWLTYLWTTVIMQMSNTVGGPVARYFAVFGGVVAYWLCVALSVVIQIYVLVSYFFALPLIAERNLGAWRALEVSRKAVGRHWFKVFGTLLMIVLVSVFIPGFVIGLLFGVVHWSLLVFGIIFVWLVPFYALCTAILYREIFGVMSVPNTIQPSL